MAWAGSGEHGACLVHMDKIFRQIRTVCSYEKCGEIVVDVQRTEPHEGSCVVNRVVGVKNVILSLIQIIRRSSIKSGQSTTKHFDS